MFPRRRARANTVQLAITQAKSSCEALCENAGLPALETVWASRTGEQSNRL